MFGKKKQKKSSLKFYIIAPLMIGVVVIAGFYLLYQPAKQYVGYKNQLTQFKQQLQLESKLVLVEQTYRSVLNIEDNKIILGFKIPQKRMLFSVNYLVRAGVDLDKTLDISLIYPDKIMIKYAAAEIFDINAQEETLQSYNNWSFPFTTIEKKDFLPILNDEQQKIAAKAWQNGLREQVDINAQVFFTTYFLALGFKNIEFQVVQ